jgi:two-component system cell cycle response regulator DivK
MTTKSVRILVVEDNEINRRLFGSLLRERGYQVLEAADGEEAITVIQKDPPALVLMDIALPKLNGLEVLRKCKGEGLLDNTKVYALTASASKDILDAGFDGVIRKPVKVLDFLSAVENTLIDKI